MGKLNKKYVSKVSRFIRSMRATERSVETKGGIEREQEAKLVDLKVPEGVA